MFCPRCSQQQSSETVRFCTKCGFHLGTVKELLATDGMPPPLQPEAPPVIAQNRRRWRPPINILLIVVVLVMIADMKNWHNTTPHISAIAVIVAILVARMFSRMGFPRGLRTPGNAILPQGNAVPSLNPPMATPVANVMYGDGRRVKTAEMVSSPPSVTERTTKLLDDKDNEHDSPIKESVE